MTNDEMTSLRFNERNEEMAPKRHNSSHFVIDVAPRARRA
jgi:phosphoribosylaminoimidazole carboxylase (NCAIR synthetase)